MTHTRLRISWDLYQTLLSSKPLLCSKFIFALFWMHVNPLRKRFIACKLYWVKWFGHCPFYHCICIHNCYALYRFGVGIWFLCSLLTIGMTKENVIAPSHLLALARYATLWAIRSLALLPSPEIRWPASNFFRNVHWLKRVLKIDS